MSAVGERGRAVILSHPETHSNPASVMPKHTTAEIRVARIPQLIGGILDGLAKPGARR